MLVFDRQVYNDGREAGVNVYVFLDRDQTVWFKAKEIAIFLGHSSETIAQILPHNKMSIICADDFEYDDDDDDEMIYIDYVGLDTILLKSKYCVRASNFKLWTTTDLLPLLFNKYKKWYK